MSGKLPLVLVILALGGFAIYAGVSSLRSSNTEGGPPSKEAPDRPPARDPEPEVAPPPTLRPDSADGPVGAVAGQVVDSSGDPVEGAEVRLATHVAPLTPEAITAIRDRGEDDPRAYYELMRRNSRILETARTDTRGRFAFATRESGPFDVTADFAGYAIAREGKVAKGTTDLLLRLARGGGIRGMVVDGEGAPIDGAVLTAADRTAITDAAGKFELAGLPPGASVRVSAQAKGYVTGSFAEAVRAGETTERAEPVVLQAEPGLIGRVLDPAGRPLEGVAVRPGRGFAQMYMGDKTDAAGRYLIRRVEDEQLTLVFRHPDYLQATVEDVPYQPGTRKVLADVALSPGGEIVGMIRGPDGEPVRGAELGALPEDRPGDFAEAVQRLVSDHDVPRSQADGTFRIAGLETGTYRLVVSARSFVVHMEQGVQVRVPEKTRVDVALSHGASITGTVVDSAGKPVAGATFSPSNHRVMINMGDIVMPDAGIEEAVTGADGRFLIRGLTEGESIELKVVAKGFVLKNLRGVEPGSKDLIVTLYRAGTVTGTVVDAETGAPISGARVGSEQAGGNVDSPDVDTQVVVFDAAATTQSATGEEGLFRLTDLTPGIHKITASADGYAPGSVAGVEVTEGNETSDIEIRLGRGESLRGVVVRASDGRAVPEAEVRFEGPVNATVKTDTAGRFESRGLLPGHYELTASAKGYAKSVLEAVLVPSAGELRIEMGAGGTVRGVVRDEKSRPLSGRNILLTQGEMFGFGSNAASSKEDGSFKFEHVTPGEYTVVAMKIGGDSGFGFSTETRKVAVREGEEVFVEFGGRASAPKTHLTGRLLDRGEPLGGRMMMFMKADVGGGLAEMMSSFKMINTDDSGRFDVKDLEPGRYRVFAGMMGPGQTGVGLDLVVTEGGEIEQDVTLPEGRLRGTVRSAKTGKGIANAKVVLVVDEAIRRPLVTIGDMMNAILAQGVTDTDGTFEIPNAEPGAHTVQVLGPDHPPVTFDGVSVRAEGGQPAAFSVPEGQRITLSAVGSDDAPVKNAEAVVFDSEGRRIIIPDRMAYALGADGKTEILLAKGAYRVLVQSESLAPVERSITVSREATESFVLTSGGLLQLTVTRLGAPVAGAVVRLFRGDGSEVAVHLTQRSMMSGGSRRETGADGTLLLPHLPPGTHRVVVTGPEGLRGEAPVRISEGGEEALRIVLR